MVTGPLVVELALVKCRQLLVFYSGQQSDPSLEWRRADVLKKKW